MSSEWFTHCFIFKKYLLLNREHGQEKGLFLDPWIRIPLKLLWEDDFHTENPLLTLSTYG